MYKNSEKILEKRGITIDVLWELEALGVLGAVDHIGGLVRRIDMSKVVEGKATGAIYRGPAGLFFMHDSPAKNLEIPSGLSPTKESVLGIPVWFFCATVLDAYRNIFHGFICRP